MKGFAIMKKNKVKPKHKKEKMQKTRFDKLQINKIKKEGKNKENLDNTKKLKKKLQNKQNKKYKFQLKQLKNSPKKPEEKNSDMSRKRRLKIWIIIVFIITTLFITRIGWIQLVDGDRLKQMALEQQSIDREISPRRGTIYDATGKNVLAISSTVNTITVNPNNIAKEDKEKVAKAVSNIFELDYDKVLKKVKKNSSIETIVKRVDKEKADSLRVWMEDNDIEVGINIDEDTKRYYPYNSLASQVIGFCGSDNQGLDGIEALYEDELQGEKGKITKVTDANGGEIDGEGENYIPAVDGNDLVLSIDATVQGIAEKYLKEACIDNECTDGGNIIVMNPKTGDILAMAGYPNYNLNEPYETTIEELKPNWDNLSETEQIKEMQKVWRNKAVADTYEPGSTFKLVTASAALEEGITTTDKEGEFCCTGGITVAGVKISCWRYYNPHGPESLREALKNSCNPVFIGLGQEIGVSKYYDYLEKFGLLKKTGIDLPGEAGSIFLKEDKVGPVELATISFGQRFEITPIQMITAVSTIANKGVYVKPRIVKQIIDSQTEEVEDMPVEEGERVISEETAEGILSMMETVVAEGTGKNAQVQGYSIGGKTGTSEDGVNTGKYVTSFVGVAPTDEPEIVILITLYNPTGEGGHQGGGVAAPIGAQVLGEILPYLEVQKEK
jgi:stage V sporulation protein D (sporulation-specific penicillin-binding protein)